MLSDISGNDIRAHKGNAKIMVTEVRNWLRVTTGKNLPSGSRLWDRYNQLTSDLQISLLEAGFTLEEIQALEFAELIEYSVRWIDQNPVASG